MENTRISTWVACATLLMACGGNEGRVSVVEPPEAGAVVVRSALFQQALATPLGTEIACSLSLSSASAVPGTAVTISGVPAGLTNALIRVISDNGDQQQVDPLFLNADAAAGTARFTTPLHPSRDPQGGNVLLELGNGQQHCPALAFAIDPLPAAPADYAQTVQQAFENYVDTAIRVSGLDPAALLQADAADVVPSDLPYWIGKQFTSADREDSLLRMANQAAADDDLLLERLLMASGIEALLNSQAEVLDMIPDGQREPVTARHWQKRYLPRTASAKLGNCQRVELDPNKLNISSPADLSMRMKAVAAARGDLGVDKNDGLRLLGGVSLSQAGNLSGSAAYAGGGLFVLRSIDEARQALEPQEITDFDVRAETLWVEDRPQSQPLRWENSTINAKGKTFNVSKAALEGLLTGIGFASGGLGAVGTAATAAGVIAPDGVNAALDAVTGDECIRIAAPRYGPIIANDEQWVTSSIEGAAIERVNHRQYRGVDQGSGVLKVELNTEQFAVQGFFEKQFTVVVEPLNLSASRSQVFVSEPGEVVELSVLVINAHTEQDDFRAIVVDDLGQIIGEQRSGNLYTVRLKTSTTREDYPTFLRLEAQNLTLPLGAPKRQLTVKFDVDGSLTIMPEEACLLPGQTLDVSAEIEGFQPGNDGVKWSSNGGSFADPGVLETVFTAPASPGTVEVMIESLTDSEVNDTVSYTVSNSCLRKAWFPAASVSVAGNGVYSQNDDPNGSSPCPLDDHDAPQVAELQTPQRLLDTQPPQVPATADLWFGRSEAFQQLLINNSSYHQGSANSDGCSSLSLDSRVEGSSVYESDADGLLRMRITADMEQRCDSHDDGSVVCADVNSIGSANAYYYLGVEQEQRYRLQGSLSCSGLSGNITIFPFSGSLQRFVNGQEPYQPESQVTGVRDAQGNYRSPQLFEVTCSDPDELLFIDEEFTLDAPAPGDTDLVVLSVLGVVQARTDAVAKEGFGPPDFSMPTFPPTPPPEPTVGQHSGTLDLELELDLEELE